MSQALFQEEQQKQVEEHLIAAAELARAGGITLEQIVDMLTILYTEGNHES